ncbi:hypothetical protein FJU10_18090 [Enterococcus sp. OL5]|nr:hypothetical protein FJU10_18090 [Enterococcus sp. OL5]
MKLIARVETSLNINTLPDFKKSNSSKTLRRAFPFTAFCFSFFLKDLFAVPLLQPINRQATF